MCGIGGILRRVSCEEATNAAEKLLDALAHRGPDDRGIFTSRDGTVALVHARLAIMDPGLAGHQPMERGGNWITFNGEIYNFRALREELKRDGERFVSGTDTEVLLALYARHGGPECLSRLRGMFAFAIWDERERSCFLARDGFGVKPLYYGFSNRGDFVFGSEVKALMATGLIERRIDDAGLESFLATGSVAEPLTMFADVRCLEAGHWMRWSAGELERKRYFQIEFGAGETTSVEALGRTREALLDSVRHHFVSDVPVGIFLSGGLDSGALVALALETGMAEVTTFSIGVEDVAQDESDAARRCAEHFGTQHREMLLTGELGGQWVGPFLEAMDQPTVDGFNTYCASKLAADHGYRVMLSGLGGDEVFGGYSSFRQVPKLLKIGRAWRSVRGIVAPVARAAERHAKGGRATRLAAYFQGAPTVGRAYEAVRSIFSPCERETICRAVMGGERCNGSKYADSSEMNDAALPDEISRLEMTRYLRNQLLRDADVMSMAHGLELRVPFIDRSLLDVLRTIPAATRLGPGKALLRAAMPELPESGAKRGFTFPFDAWLETNWSELKDELRGAPAIPLDSWSRKWSLIVLSRWLRRYGFAGWRR